MPCKKLFFNPTLFRKNMSRSWPLWGGVTLVGALFPLYLILALFSDGIMMEQQEFASFLYQASAYFLPAFTCGYAILVAMFVWSYLHNSRSVGMMHALAISRTELFVTNTLSALAMLLVPYTVVGGMLCLIAGICGALDVTAVLLTITAVLLENLLFFGMGTLCAMVTGSVVAAAAYYVVINFAAVVLDLLVNSLAEAFIFGLGRETSDLSIWFSPLVSLYNYVDVNHRGEMPKMEGFHWIVIYGVVGLVLLALGWFLYQMRRSESAGDVVAFAWLRPVFRVGLAFISALTLGRLLYELLWGTLFQSGSYADAVPMAVCAVLCAVVGYYVASMLLEKSLRVFKGSSRGVLVVAVMTAVLCFGVSMDILGLEQRIPDEQDIERIEVSGPIDFVCNADTTPQLIHEIIDLHQKIIDDAEYAMSFERYYWSDDMAWTYIYFTYFQKDGSRLERHYRIPLTLERMEDRTTYDGKMAEIAGNTQAVLASISIPSGATLDMIRVYGRSNVSGEWEGFSPHPDYVEMIYAAMQRDAAEGNFLLDNDLYGMWGQDAVSTVLPETFKYEPHMDLEYRIEEESYGRYYSKNIQLQPGMTHTLNALLSTGVITQADVDCWMDE